jgi:hypothetical protein
MEFATALGGRALRKVSHHPILSGPTSNRRAIAIMRSCSAKGARRNQPRKIVAGTFAVAINILVANDGWNSGFPQKGVRLMAFL